MCRRLHMYSGVLKNAGCSFCLERQISIEVSAAAAIAAAAHTHRFASVQLLFFSVDASLDEEGHHIGVASQPFSRGE